MSVNCCEKEIRECNDSYYVITAINNMTVVLRCFVLFQRISYLYVWQNALTQPGGTQNKIYR